MASDHATDLGPLDLAPLDLERLREGIVALADAAGAAILKIYATDFAVTKKADASPVTAADVASQRVIIEGLARLTPSVPVIAEETQAPSFAERRGWRRFWLVDPLDGTKEFVKRNGEFSVNIALVEDGVPVLGVVHAPVAGITYTGVAAHAGHAASAWRFDAEGGAHPIHTRPPENGVVRVMVSRSHSNEATQAFIEKLRQEYGAVETIARGSAIKSCLVADGTAHFYPRLGPTMWWDTAAAQAVLMAAGGEMVVTGESGGALRYDRDVLSNPSFVALFSLAATFPS
ncbi:MAG TPA: 3'(2'),5'-bisphosphate nucleotidase CysQ [Trueperaceae bacterium]|nr:3'(2'),5'-bisphosphate nucleotidase CysQ [Trueperaceae bacterium]